MVWLVLENFRVGVRSAKCSTKVGNRPLFLFDGDELVKIQEQIEKALATTAPDIEVISAEVEQGKRLRIFIDHSEGVTLAHCEQVTRALDDLRERYAIEVSSPGSERPLTKPQHFKRFIGQRARVRTRVARDGHRSFTGELIDASEDAVTVAVPEGVVSIPFAEIQRSNLISD